MAPSFAKFNSPEDGASRAWRGVYALRAYTYHVPRTTLLPFQYHAWHEAWHVLFFGIKDLRPFRGMAWHEFFNTTLGQFLMPRRGMTVAWKCYVF
jgi:hypothetical protein